VTPSAGCPCRGRTPPRYGSKPIHGSRRPRAAVNPHTRPHLESGGSMSEARNCPTYRDKLAIAH
jgi:hypothetical protein